MVDSINPSNLLEFAKEVAEWSLRSPDTLNDELNDVLKVINTFADNQDNTVYKMASGVACTCIAAIQDFTALAMQSMQEPIPEPEPEPKPKAKKEDK